MDGNVDATAEVIAARLTRLIETIHPLSRGRYSVREIADAINEKAGRKVLSHSYVHDLQRGHGVDPTVGRLAALADFFGVALEYFFDEEIARRTDEQLDSLAILRDKGVRSIALRSNGLSPKSLHAIATMIETARDIEGLD